jgi:hypothetical protein
MTGSCACATVSVASPASGKIKTPAPQERQDPALLLGQTINHFRLTNSLEVFILLQFKTL